MTEKFDISKFAKRFIVDDDTKYDSMYTEKITVLKNGEWQYDTYIRHNRSISKNSVKKFILGLEKGYAIESIKYEFYGGPPMGTTMMDYNEIKGDNIWVVNLKPDARDYFKKMGYSDNLHNMYDLIGGKYKITKNKIEYEKYNVSDIKNIFILDQDRILNKKYFKDVDQLHTMYDGEVYYSFINVYKDGKFLDKVKIESKNNPIIWKVIINKIDEINKNKNFFGYIYKLSYSFNQGLILETTKDKRYNIKY